MKTISIPRYRVLQDVVNNLKVGVGTWNSFDTTTFQLVANNSDFNADGIVPGDIVFNPENSSTWAKVVSVDSATQLTLDGVFSTTIIGGATELKRFSIGNDYGAFTIETGAIRAQDWWSNYKVGDRIQSQGQQSRTLANQAVGTIVDITIDLDGPNPGARIVSDIPMQTSNEIWVYKDDITTIPVNEISGIEFYKSFEGAIGEVSASLYIGNDEFYGIESQVFEFKNREDVLTYQPKFEAAIMNAVSETLRSPWPDSNVMIEGSHGWQVSIRD